jgi:hypothetical protein
MKSSVSILITILVLAFPLSAHAGEPASATVRSAVTQLVEGGEGQVFVVVVNTSRHSIRIENVVPFEHPFIAVRRGGPALPVEIPPGQSQAIPYDLKANDNVETGEQLLLWQVDYGWDEAGTSRKGRLVAETRLRTKVLGESELLSALQLPSLLLLPGVLFLIMMPKLASLRRRFFPVEGDREPVPGASFVQTAADALRPERVVMAVLFSLAMTFSYRWLSGRDFLVRYGLLDIFIVCLLSVLAAALACACEYGALRARLWWHERRDPNEGDGPIEALLKLARRGGQNISLPQIDASFVVAEDKDGFWMVPPIRVDERAMAVPGLRERLEDLLEAGVPQRIAEFLRLHGELQPRWKQDGPRYRKRADTVNAARRPSRRLVEI